LAGAFVAGAFLAGAFVAGAFLAGAFVAGAFLVDFDLLDGVFFVATCAASRREVEGWKPVWLVRNHPIRVSEDYRNHRSAATSREIRYPRMTETVAYFHDHARIFGDRHPSTGIGISMETMGPIDRNLSNRCRTSVSGCKRESSAS
jgi:hypothetical protein